MNSERNILSKLLEGKVCVERCESLDEKTYTVGDTQYWKRSGKYYSWTEAGGRKEIGEDDYMKAISGGSSGGSVKNTEPSKDAAKKDPEPSKKSDVPKSDTNKVNNSGTKDYVIPRSYKDPRRDDLEKTLRDEIRGMGSGDIISIDDDDFVKSSTPNKFIRRTTVNGKEYKDVVNGTYILQQAMVMGVKDKKVSVKKKSEEIEMPKGMRAVQTPSGKFYRVDNPTTGSDWIQINPTGDGKYELAVIDRQNLAGSYKRQGLSKKDAFELAKDVMNKPTPEPKSEPSPIEKRRNAFSDDSESDYVNYGGVRDFDHTTWEVDGEEATIQRNPSGRGYYLQTEDYDEEFDTKGDLVHFLRSHSAEFQGYDSEKDY